jgi:hypothetical protein
MMTPHFTSAIAAFGIVFFSYGALVASELWFLYRKHFVETALALKEKKDKGLIDQIKFFIFCTLTLGVYDISEESLKKDEKAIKLLAGLGIPIACFLHGMRFEIHQLRQMPCDTVDAGHIHHVRNRFGNCSLFADVHRCHGDKKAARVTQKDTLSNVSVERGVKERRDTCRQDDFKVPSLLYDLCYKS